MYPLELTKIFFNFPLLISSSESISDWNKGLGIRAHEIAYFHSTFMLYFIFSMN
ncbi:hypothetical protein, partial [Plasmodium yoelii yoelii]